MGSRDAKAASNPASAALGRELGILFEGEKSREGHSGNANWRTKKEEFPGFMETCCLGTPFPRSALFLETSCGYLDMNTRVLRGCGLK